jgi:hypothetical protein
MRLSALPTKRAPLALVRTGAIRSTRAVGPSPASAKPALPLASASTRLSAPTAFAASGPTGEPASPRALSASERRKSALPLARAKRTCPSNFGAALPTLPLASRLTVSAAKSAPRSRAMSASMSSFVSTAVPSKRARRPIRSAATGPATSCAMLASALPFQLCKSSDSERSSAICGDAAVTRPSAQRRAPPRKGPTSCGRTSRTRTAP